MQVNGDRRRKGFDVRQRKFASLVSITDARSARSNQAICRLFHFRWLPWWIVSSDGCFSHLLRWRHRGLLPISLRRWHSTQRLFLIIEQCAMREECAFHSSESDTMGWLGREYLLRRSTVSIRYSGSFFALSKGHPAVFEQPSIFFVPSIHRMESINTVKAIYSIE